MFTGIVEEIGKIRGIKRGGLSESLEISCSDILSDLKIGDSVSVNGICLTCTRVTSDSFTCDVMAETMRRTSLGNAGPGGKVNLERAMALGGRLGGHIVSGHIDGTGIIRSMAREENAVWIEISASPKIMDYVIEKGSVAVDGISLTVAWVSGDSFKVSVIPHTLDVTILGEKHIGDMVNLENDIIGKYVEKMINKDGGDNDSRFESLLSENGFI